MYCRGQNDFPIDRVMAVRPPYSFEGTRDKLHNSSSRAGGGIVLVEEENK